MYKRENNIAYIDSQNLHLAIKAQGWKLDYRKFRVYLSDRFTIRHAKLFLGYMPQYHSIYSDLKQCGFEIIFKKISQREKVIKGNIDVDLTFSVMCDLCNNVFDKAVIITGDGDFFKLIEHLRKNERLKRIIIPNMKAYSSLLREFHAETTFINGLKKNLEKEIP